MERVVYRGDMTHPLQNLDPEDQDTLKAGALGAATGIVLGGAVAAGNALAGVVTHRSALDAAQEEYDALYGTEGGLS